MTPPRLPKWLKQLPLPWVGEWPGPILWEKQKKIKKKKKKLPTPEFAPGSDHKILNPGTLWTTLPIQPPREAYVDLSPALLSAAVLLGLLPVTACLIVRFVVGCRLVVFLGSQLPEHLSHPSSKTCEEPACSGSSSMVCHQGVAGLLSTSRPPCICPTVIPRGLGGKG